MTPRDSDVFQMDMAEDFPFVEVWAAVCEQNLKLMGVFFNPLSYWPDPIRELVFGK